MKKFWELLKGLFKFYWKNPLRLAECFIEAFVAMLVSALITLGILALAAVMVDSEFTVSAELLLLLFALVAALIVPRLKLFERGD